MYQQIWEGLSDASVPNWPTSEENLGDKSEKERFEINQLIISAWGLAMLVSLLCQQNFAWCDQIYIMLCHLTSVNFQDTKLAIPVKNFINLLKFISGILGTSAWYIQSHLSWILSWLWWLYWTQFHMYGNKQIIHMLEKGYHKDVVLYYPRFPEPTLIYIDIYINSTAAMLMGRGICHEWKIEIPIWHIAFWLCRFTSLNPSMSSLNGRQEEVEIQCNTNHFCSLPINRHRPPPSKHHKRSIQPQNPDDHSYAMPSTSQQDNQPEDIVLWHVL